MSDDTCPKCGAPKDEHLSTDEYVPHTVYQCGRGHWKEPAMCDYAAGLLKRAERATELRESAEELAHNLRSALRDMEHWHDQWKAKAMREQQRAERAEAASLEEHRKRIEAECERDEAHERALENLGHANRLQRERNRYKAALRAISSNMMSRTDMVETARAALEAEDE